MSEIEPPVSIIICARNELKNLKANLQQVLEQDYSRFQVIVVNDCSWDESQKYLEELSVTYTHLKVVSIKEQERYQHGKKFALTIGIKSALYDHLLLIDADCYPASNQWMRLMMQRYKQKTRIVIGYGAYIKTSSILNQWIRFDTAFNAIQYLFRQLKPGNFDAKNSMKNFSGQALALYVDRKSFFSLSLSTNSCGHLQSDSIDKFFTLESHVIQS